MLNDINYFLINILIFQFIQLTFGTIFHTLVIISIIGQISLYDIFGQSGCIIFWLSDIIQAQILITGGFGMSVFRMICIENRVIQINKERLVQIIHSVGLAIVICNVTLIFFGIINTGWEKNGMYQFCKDYGTAKVEVHHSYNNLQMTDLGK